MNSKEGIGRGLRVIFWGSPEDALPGLRILAREAHVLAVCTRPDRPAGRGRAPAPTAVKAAALEMGLPVRTPADPGAEAEELRRMQADAFVIIAYGRLLPAALLEVPRLGSVNLHPSLLPRYRGPSPVATAILEGAAETGVSVMLADEGLDTGPLLRQSAPVQIGPDATRGALQRQLFALGAEMLPQVLRDLDSGALEPRPQGEGGASRTRMFSKEDGRIDWTGTAEEAGRRVRACDPWPGAHSSFEGRMLKVLRAAHVEVAAGLAPGAVALADGALLVGCGKGALRVERAQLAGGRALEGRDLTNGMRRLAGANLPS